MKYFNNWLTNVKYRKNDSFLVIYPYNAQLCRSLIIIIENFQLYNNKIIYYFKNIEGTRPLHDEEYYWYITSEIFDQLVYVQEEIDELIDNKYIRPLEDNEAAHILLKNNIDEYASELRNFRKRHEEKLNLQYSVDRRDDV